MMDSYAMSRRLADTLILLSIMALTGLFAWFFVDFSIHPYEDAAMLMRYADHVAHGAGIVWNIGEPPVDGATDFLFMIFVAVVRRAGFSLEISVRLITLLAHFGTAGLIYAGMRQVQRAGIIPAFLSAAYLALGPGLFLSAAYFGTAFFGLAVAVAWILAQRLISSAGRSSRGYLFFSLACLVVGLIRPEGVLIGVLILISLGVLIPLKEYRKLAIVFGAVFLTLGGTYFLWRWSYFGHPLPNPFYKKGGGHLYVLGLKESFWNSFWLLYPLVPAFALSVRRTSTFRTGIAFLIPIAGSVGMWVLISSATNFGGRFQYPTLVLGVLSWFPLVRTLRDDLRLPRFASLARMQRIALVLVAASVLAIVFRQHVSRSVAITYADDGRYAVGVMLGEYAARNYTIATTEAGLLPLYSRWRAIDTWGLNDQWIAHHGLITEEYLDRQRPDIIMWHGYFSPLHPMSPKSSRWLWHRQILALQRYAERHDFTLAAVFGVSPKNTHYYYVRAELPEHDEIVQRIRSMDYAWFGNGRKSNNYVGPRPPEDISRSGSGSL